MKFSIKFDKDRMAHDIYAAKKVWDILVYSGVAENEEIGIICSLYILGSIIKFRKLILQHFMSPSVAHVEITNIWHK